MFIWGGWVFGDWVVWVSQRLLIISWAFLWPWKVGAMRRGRRWWDSDRHNSSTPISVVSNSTHSPN